jgi:hypothetical protein
MAKYVMTKDGSIGGKLVGDDKVLVATVIDGQKVVEIVEITSDIIDQVAPVLTKIIRALQDFFNSVFHRFPTVIKVNGKNYVFTEQKAPFKAIDRVFYMNNEDKNDILFKHEAQQMPQAKKELRKELKSMGYMS